MKKVIFILLYSLSALAVTPDVDLEYCSDLAKSSCRNGHYDDGTGVVKSISEIQSAQTQYVDKSRAYLKDYFQKALDKSENADFRKTSFATFGFNSSDDTNSTKDNVVENLSLLVQKQTMYSILPSESQKTMPSMAGSYAVVNSSVYLAAIEALGKDVEENLDPGVAPMKQKEALGKDVQQKPELTTAQMKQKIEKEIFPNVKNLLHKHIDELSSISSEQKKLLLAKIDSIQYSIANCRLFPTPAESVAALFVPNAVYEKNNTFKYCVGAPMQSKSEFEIAATIAHELSHSIDPCTLTRDSGKSADSKSITDIKKMEAAYPLKNIVSCLSDPASIGAVNINASPRTKTLTPEEYFCNRTQANESFADWMSAEITPRYMQNSHPNLSPAEFRIGYANMYRLLCIKSDSLPPDEQHPDTRLRINKIFLANPKIREQLGCPATKSPLYCDPNASSGPTTSVAPSTGGPGSPQKKKGAK